jgi:hypothetical protein
MAYVLCISSSNERTEMRPLVLQCHLMAKMANRISLENAN